MSQPVGQNMEGVLRVVGKASLEKAFLQKLVDAHTHEQIANVAREGGVTGLTKHETDFLSEVARTLQTHESDLKAVRSKWGPDKGR